MAAISRLLLLVACLLIIRNGESQLNSSSCFPSDLQALRTFAAGFHAVFRDDSNPAVFRKVSIEELWSSEQDCCSWMGVSCSTAATNYSRVTELSLSFIEFSVSSAAILESLCNLPLLSTLQLSALPSIYSLSTAPIVLLQIPECLGDQLSLLQVLKLYSLYLEDPIPSSFSRLLHLQLLDLSYNPNLSRPLLPLLLLPNLTSLSLSYCNFSASLPSFHTPLLQTLSLSNNAFSGPLPTFYTPLLQSLSLSSNKISGPIPSSIFTRLSNLQYLNLQGNSLSGPLPSSLCQLSHLQTLVLSANLLSIAELPHPEYCSQLINLTSLDLSSNQFTGRFPPWIGRLSSLQSLDLSFNHFSSPLPDEWQNLHSLSAINLGSGNSLNATRLPDWLFRVPNLTRVNLVSMGLQSEDVLCSTRVSMLNNTLQMLDLSGNNITGGRDLLECFTLHNFTTRPGQLLLVWVNDNPLSMSLSDIRLSPTISSLGLSGCNLTGFLTDKVFEGRSYLNLSHNHLVGKIPTKHTNLTGAMLLILDLSHNYFTGFDSYGSFPSLFSAQLSNNLIAGDVSTVLRTVGLALDNSTSGLWALALSNNELVGQIPTSLAECHPNLLTALFLDNNNLTGEIPENFGTFMNMFLLSLTNNLLNGTIPSTIITKNIKFLELSHNKLEGDLKTVFSFSSPSNLIVLGLAHNRISGSIPPFLGNFTPSLQVMDLSHNNLIGSIPQDLYLPSFQNVEIISDFDTSIYALTMEMSLVIKGVKRTLAYVLKNFRFLDLSDNQLEGDIPSHLGDLSAMMQLNLSHNKLSGAIPEAFGKLLNIETLDLSFNKLSGSIPQSLLSLTLLGTFNVSYNEALVGPIPLGTQLENNESYIGDPMLCGYQVQRSCPLAIDITRPSNNKTIANHVLAWINKWISIPGLCLGIVVAFVGVLCILHGPHILHGTSCIPKWCDVHV